MAKRTEIPIGGAASLPQAGPGNIRAGVASTPPLVDLSPVPEQLFQMSEKHVQRAEELALTHAKKRGMAQEDARVGSNEEFESQILIDQVRKRGFIYKAAVESGRRDAFARKLMTEHAQLLTRMYNEDGKTGDPEFANEAIGTEIGAKFQPEKLELQSAAMLQELQGLLATVDPSGEIAVKYLDDFKKLHASVIRDSWTQYTAERRIRFTDQVDSKFEYDRKKFNDQILRDMFGKGTGSREALIAGWENFKKVGPKIIQDFNKAQHEDRDYRDAHASDIETRQFRNHDELVEQVLNVIKAEAKTLGANDVLLDMQEQLHKGAFFHVNKTLTLESLDEARRVVANDYIDRVDDYFKKQAAGDFSQLPDTREGRRNTWQARMGEAAVRGVDFNEQDTGKIPGQYIELTRRGRADAYWAGGIIMGFANNKPLDIGALVPEYQTLEDRNITADLTSVRNELQDGLDPARILESADKNGKTIDLDVRARLEQLRDEGVKIKPFMDTNMSTTLTELNKGVQERLKIGLSKPEQFGKMVGYPGIPRTSLADTRRFDLEDIYANEKTNRSWDNIGNQMGEAVRLQTMESARYAAANGTPGLALDTTITDENAKYIASVLEATARDMNGPSGVFKVTKTANGSEQFVEMPNWEYVDSLIDKTLDSVSEGRRLASLNIQAAPGEVEAAADLTSHDRTWDKLADALPDNLRYMATVAKVSYTIGPDIGAEWTRRFYDGNIAFGQFYRQLDESRRANVDAFVNKYDRDDDAGALALAMGGDTPAERAQFSRQVKIAASGLKMQQEALSGGGEVLLTGTSLAHAQKALLEAPMRYVAKVVLNDRWLGFNDGVYALQVPDIEGLKGRNFEIKTAFQGAIDNMRTRFGDASSMYYRKIVESRAVFQAAPNGEMVIVFKRDGQVVRNEATKKPIVYRIGAALAGGDVKDYSAFFVGF